MEEARLSRRQLLAIALAGLLTAALAVGITAFVLSAQATTYRAQAQVVLVPGPQIKPDQAPSYFDSLGGGQAGNIAAQVLVQPRWKAVAATAAGVPEASIVTTAGVVPNTSLINVTAETTSPEAAETALTAILAAAKPLVEQVSGPFSLTIVQPADGTAVSTSIPRAQLLVVVFASGLLIGSGLALVVARLMRRPDPLVDRYPTTPPVRSAYDSPTEELSRPANGRLREPDPARQKPSQA